MMQPAPLLLAVGAVLWTLLVCPDAARESVVLAAEDRAAPRAAQAAPDAAPSPRVLPQSRKTPPGGPAAPGAEAPAFVLPGGRLALAVWLLAAPLFALWWWRRTSTRGRERHRRMANALSSHRELLETVFHITEDSIIILDATFHVVMANRIAAERFGLDPETILGLAILDQIEEPVASSRRMHLFEALNTEQTVRFTDSRAGRTYDITLNPIRQGAGKHLKLAIYARDITDQLGFEAALREKQERLDKVFRLTPVVVAITAQDTERIIEINEAFTAISGYRRDEAIGRTLDELSLWLRPGDRETIEAAIARDGLIRDFEIPVRFKDCRTATALFSAIPLEAYGQPCLLSVVVDITGRKTMEEALRQAKDSAEAANRAKSQFLSTMSHEIRTPMNTILGMVDVLRTTPLTERQQQFLRTLEVAGEALMALLSNILELSKIESGTLEMACIPFDPAAVERQALDMLRPQAERKALVLTSRVAEDVPGEAYGDPDRLRQILVNLLNNAIKFTGQGEIRVEVSRLTTLSGRDEILYTVADTGIGIAQDKQQAIFEPFTQADSSTTRAYGGSGLGLAISAMLTEGMGGRLWVESLPGRGSTFFCAVPQDRRLRQGHAPKTIPALWPKAPPQPPSTSWKSVLIVEDSEPNRLLYQLFLENLPLALSFATSGEEGLSLFEHHTFDAIIMDIQLPGIDGLTAIKEIRQREAASGCAPTPILVITAHAFREESGRVFEAGCDALLTKPIQKSRFIEVLEKLLQRHKEETTGNAACAWTTPPVTD